MEGVWLYDNAGGNPRVEGAAPIHRSKVHSRRRLCAKGAGKIGGAGKGITATLAALTSVLCGGEPFFLKIAKAHRRNLVRCRPKKASLHPVLTRGAGLRGSMRDLGADCLGGFGAFFLQRVLVRVMSHWQLTYVGLFLNINACTDANVTLLLLTPSNHLNYNFPA